VDSLCHPCITTTHLSYNALSLRLPPPPCPVLLVRCLNSVTRTIWQRGNSKIFFKKKKKDVKSVEMCTEERCEEGRGVKKVEKSRGGDVKTVAMARE